jgi:formylglycine-generating enzyme required for sulfatase activity
MVMVEGNYCPSVKHECLEHTKEWDDEQERREELKAKGLDLPQSRIAERCLRFAEPSTCLSKARRLMRFCIDSHEWPNQVGEKPTLLVTWHEAKAACEQAGKRLCTADEFDFACEGEAMLPYSYGFLRDAKRCNIDKPYITPRRRLMPLQMCLNSAVCKEQLEEIDQRSVIGDSPNCTSPFGAFDLNGNVNEWVSRPEQEAPNRSGLKGGWWGPARSRCRPMVTVHKESYVGYEVGFRCCKDAPR